MAKPRQPTQAQALAAAEPADGGAVARAASARTRVPVLLAYGNLALPIAFLGYPLGLFLHPYYATELGLGLAAISTVLLITRAFDFVTDPLIGWLSDRTKTRLGRRRPYIMLGVPITMLGVWKLFFPEPPVDIWYMLLWNTVMYFGWTMITLPWGALGGELSENYMDRARIMSVRQVFTIVGLIGSSAVMWLSQQYLGKERPADVLDTLGTIVLVSLPVCVLILAVIVPERQRRAASALPSLPRSLRSLLKVGPFRRIIYMALAIVVGEAARHAVAFFFIQDILDAGDRIGLAYTGYFLFGVLAIPMWQWLARRHGKHRALAIAMINGSLTSLGTVALGPGDFTIFLVLFVVKGLSFGAFAYLPLAMIADVVDVDRAMHRQERAGLFFAFQAAVDKVGMAVGLFLALQLLNLAGYDPQGVETTAVGWIALRVEYAVLPGLFFALATAIIWNYPLTQARHEVLVARLARREARREAIAGNARIKAVGASL
ncbi:MAG: MFS transporter [Gammaproteobacteria bacterium]|nr:MFS transporter [Gammaproteobacteria bacterium]